MTTDNHSHDIDYKKDFTVEVLPVSQVKITGEIPVAEIEKQKPAAIKELGKDVELDGFRKGHVPETVLIKQLGEMRILAEAAERALAHNYPHILDAHEIDAIGHPQVEVTKLAPDNPLGFTAIVATIPEVTLPDYNQAAKEANSEKTTDEVSREEEVDAQIKAILRQKRAYERMQEKAATQAEAGEAKSDDTTELPTPESEAAKQAEAEEENEPEPDLNDLTDEVVKTLGEPGQFETVADFRAKVREHLEIEKARDNATRHRAKITDAIIDQATIELPEVLIDSEINQMFAQMEEDIKRANLEFDDYLTHIKKTRDDLRTEWRPAAEKRAKLQLILNEIAKEENITPNKDELEAQTKQLMEQHKDADEHRVRVYVASVLLNEAVMKHLEAQV